MSFPDIAQLVPHDGDMVLLERVLAADAETLTAELEIRLDTLFCDGAGVGAWVGAEPCVHAGKAVHGHRCEHEACCGARDARVWF